MMELLPLFEKWCNQYCDDPGKVKRYLSESVWTAREAGRSVYQYYVNSKQIDKLESRDEAYKRRVWETAKEWNRELSKEETVKLSKIIYLLENVLQKEVK